MKNILILVVALISLNLHAASFFTDPYFGLVLGGETEQTNTQYEFEGIAYGARLGFKNLGLFGGLEYSLSTVDLKMTKPSAGSSKSYDGTFMGIFIGYKLPLLRFFGSYFFNAKLEGESNKYDGTGYSLGFGYTGFPIISLNFEYRIFAYDQNNETSMATDLSSKELFINVSLPIEF